MGLNGTGAFEAVFVLTSPGRDEPVRTPETQFYYKITPLLRHVAERLAEPAQMVVGQQRLIVHVDLLASVPNRVDDGLPLLFGLDDVGVHADSGVEREVHRVAEARDSFSGDVGVVDVAERGDAVQVRFEPSRNDACGPAVVRVVAQSVGYVVVERYVAARLGEPSNERLDHARTEVEQVVEDGMGLPECREIDRFVRPREEFVAPLADDRRRTVDVDRVVVGRAATPRTETLREENLLCRPVHGLILVVAELAPVSVEGVREADGFELNLPDVVLGQRARDAREVLPDLRVRGTERVVVGRAERALESILGILGSQPRVVVADEPRVHGDSGVVRQRHDVAERVVGLRDFVDGRGYRRFVEVARRRVEVTAAGVGFEQPFGPAGVERPNRVVVARNVHAVDASRGEFVEGRGRLTAEKTPRIRPRNSHTIASEGTSNKFCMPEMSSTREFIRDGSLGVSMPVTDIEAIPVTVDVQPRDEGLGLAPYVSNHDEVTEVTRMLVRVDTDEGVTGWGEMLVGMKSARVTKAVMEDVIAPELIGRKVSEIRPFVEEFYYPYVKVRPFLGAVETALWDALGKKLGAPVHELLGGKTRDEIPIAHCLGILGPAESRKYVRRAYDAGFRTLKTKAGHDWRTDVERLVAMHDEVDGDMEFRIDPNQGWTTEDAVRVAARLEDEGVFLQYLEQPVRIDSPGTYRSLRQRLRTPIAVNEDAYFPRNLYHLLKEDAIDVGVLDLVPAGGILRVREQAAVASAAGVSLSHHCGFDLGVKTAAVLHTVAATPAINLAPDSVYYGWDDYVVQSPLDATTGSIRVPDGPGLGVEVDWAKIEKYRVD